MVSYEDGSSRADGNTLFFEISAKDETNIELALMTFVAEIRKSTRIPKIAARAVSSELSYVEHASAGHLKVLYSSLLTRICDMRTSALHVSIPDI